MAEGVGNPYVGPRPFTEADSENFFGRERANESLAALVSANRLTLFYAPSGAGKSSLIHARLIPTLRLEEQFTILPVARVGVAVGDQQGSHDANIYVFNLITWLEAGRTDDHHAAGHTADCSPEAHTHLADYLRFHLAGLTAPDTTGAELSPLLVIDQFEEILTTYPNRWQARGGFFRQLAQAMYTQESLWVLLSLREEYVGALERYAWLLPGKLRARFYMRRLNHQAALEAIARPAANHDRPFAEGVAAKLVQDLAQIRVEGEGAATAPGEFVEPIQLQVVCQRLWENLRQRSPGPITAQDLAELGDVNQALAQFYDDEIRSVVIDPAIPVNEREVRQWFSDALVTPAGTRGTVFQEAETTGGLDNRAVARFEARHLIRGEPRAGGKWYELVHDRLIEPIQESNSAWFTAHQSPITQAAQDWLADGRNPAKLYSGSLLAEVRTQLQKEPEIFSELEEEFIAAGLTAEQQRKTRRLTIIVAGVFAAFAIMAGLTVWALQQAKEAREAQSLAETRRLEALQEGAVAATARATAEAALHRVRAESLASQARMVYVQSPPRALLLAVEALREHPATDSFYPVVAEQSLRDLLGNPGGVPLVGHTDSVLAVAFSPQGDWLASASADATIRLWSTAALTEHGAFVNALAFSPDGKQMASASGDGMVLLWEVATGQVTEFLLDSSANALVFSPDGRLIAAGTDSATYLWETASAERPAPWFEHDGPVLAVAFSPVGDLLASAGFEQTIHLWQIEPSGDEPRSLTGHSGSITALAFHPDGERLVSAGEDGEIRLWNLRTAKTVQQFTHEQAVRAVVFTADRRGLITGGDDHVLRWWEELADPTLPPDCSTATRMPSAPWRLTLPAAG